MLALHLTASTPTSLPLPVAGERQR